MDTNSKSPVADQGLKSQSRKTLNEKKYNSMRDSFGNLQMQMSQRNSTVASPQLDFTVSNIEHTKPGNLPIEMLIDVGRHNLRLQKLEAQKNAEKQRYYNSKVDHVGGQNKTFQTKATKVQFETTGESMSPKAPPPTNGSDEWMLILSKQQRQAGQRQMTMELLQKQRTADYSAELLDQIRANKNDLTTKLRTEDNRAQQHIKQQSDWLDSNVLAKSMSREKLTKNMISLQNSQLKHKAKLQRAEDKRTKYYQREIDLKNKVDEMKANNSTLQNKLINLSYQEQIKRDANKTNIKRQVEIQRDKDLFNSEKQLFIEHQDLHKTLRLESQPQLKPFIDSYSLKYNMKKSPNGHDQKIRTAQNNLTENITDTRKIAYIKNQIEGGEDKFVAQLLKGQSAVDQKRKSTLKKMVREWEGQKDQQLYNQNQFKTLYQDPITFGNNHSKVEIQRLNEQNVFGYNIDTSNQKFAQQKEYISTQRIKTENPLVIKNMVAMVNPQLFMNNMSTPERKLNKQFLDEPEVQK